MHLSRTIKPSHFLSALIAVIGVFSWGNAALAQCANNSQCPAGAVCAFPARTCDNFQLNLSALNLSPTSMSFGVGSNTGSQNFNLQSCMGQAAACGTPTSGILPWTLYAPVANSYSINATNLRSGRSYMVNLWGESHGTSQIQNVPFTTWPGYLAEPVASNITPNSATVSWITDYLGTSEVYYGLNPASWAADSPGLVAGDQITGMTAANDGTAWLVTQSRKIAKRSGTSWAAQTNPAPSAALNDVDAYDASTAWIVGDGSLIMRTTDGTTWATTATPGVINQMYGVYAPTKTTAWAAGVAEQLLFFDGTSWVHKHSLGGGETLRTVTTVDNTVAWTAGTGGKVFRWEAASWTPQALPGGAGHTIYAVSTLDGQTIWAGGDNGKIWRYSALDGGWKLQFDLTDNAIYRIKQISPREVWFLGDRFAYYSWTADQQFPGANAFAAPANIMGTPPKALAVAHGNDILAGGGDKVVSYNACHVGCAIKSELTPTKNHQVNLDPDLMSSVTYAATVASISPSTQSAIQTFFTTADPDTTPPVITITDPSTSPYAAPNANFTMRGATSDNDGVQVVTVTSDRTGGQPVSGTTSWSSTISLLPGNNVITVTAEDTAGNTSTAAVTIVRDTQAPTVSITNPEDGSPVISADIFLDGSANDDTLVQSMDWSLNGGPRSSIPISPADALNWSVSGTGLQPGLNTLTVYALDSAGNEGWGTVTVNYTQKDFLFSVTPASQTKNAGEIASYTVRATSRGGFSGMVTVSVTGQPAGSIVTPTHPNVPAGGTGTGAFTVALDPSTVGGTYRLTVTGTSGALTKTANVDLIVQGAPSFTLSTTGAQTVNAGQTATYTITASANSSFAGTITWSASSLPAGATASFVPAATPLMTNQTDSVTLTVRTQTTTPGGMSAITVTAASSVTKTINVDLTVNAGKSVDLTMAPTALTVTAGGAGGNFNGTVRPQGGFDDVVSVTTSAAPNHPGLHLSVSPDNFRVTDPTLSQFSLTARADSVVPAGTYMITMVVSSTTLTPAVTDTASVSLKVGADTAGPVISNIIPTPNANSVRVTWSTNEEANAELRIYADAQLGTLLKTVSSSNYCTDCHDLTDFPLNPSTTYYFTVTSADRASPPNSTTRTKQNDNVTPLQFTTAAVPDTIIPTITLTEPTTGTTVLGIVPIRGQAGDNQSVSAVRITITAESTGASVPVTNPPCTGASCSYQQNWNTTGLPNDTYAIKVIAVDNAGNSSAPASVTVTVANDTTAPILQGEPVVEIAPGCYNGGSCSAVIRWQTDDMATSEVSYGTTVNCNNGPCVFNGPTVDHDDLDPNRTDPYRQVHQVTLPSLAPNTLYHYRITSCNATPDCVN